MLFRDMPTDELRNRTRHQIETLERWLRRLIDDVLNANFDGSLATLPIKNNIKETVSSRRTLEPSRYQRDVDALLFDDLVTILCHPELYQHFHDSLGNAFPDGAAEARTFLNRIVEARNPLAHANEITHHQALRVLCYSTDVIESLKIEYKRRNMAQDYNAPSFYRVWDDRGNSREVHETGQCFVDFREIQLRPGDTLQLEVQPDESFSEDSYQIEWTVNNISPAERGLGRRFSLTITNKHVNQSGLVISASIISNLEWHRHSAYDARLTISYSVLPPI